MIQCSEITNDPLMIVSLSKVLKTRPSLRALTISNLKGIAMVVKKSLMTSKECMEEIKRILEDLRVGHQKRLGRFSLDMVLLRVQSFHYNKV